MGEWYYIGHYGQLGPLTREQIDELIAGGVIGRETFVWRTGLNDWLPAERCIELSDAFRLAGRSMPPPQPSVPVTPMPPAPQVQQIQPIQPIQSMLGYSSPDYLLAQSNAYQPAFSSLRSDRSRTVAGILQILLPGVGRMYLGYLAYGVIQLALTVITCGFLWPWSFIDGIIILSGGVKLDGYGRQIPD